MENRPKSSLEVCWALLGPLGAPYWPPWTSWEHLGSVLRASWTVLGASRRHPGSRRGPHMDPRMAPSSRQNRSKIALIFWSIFRCDCDPKLITQAFQKLPKKLSKKVFPVWVVFFIHFLDWSWGPKYLKMSTSCTREAHFHKIAFSDSDIFLEAQMMKKGSQNGAKMV